VNTQCAVGEFWKHCGLKHYEIVDLNAKLAKVWLEGPPDVDFAKRLRKSQVASLNASSTASQAAQGHIHTWLRESPNRSIHFTSWTPATNADLVNMFELRNTTLEDVARFGDCHDYVTGRGQPALTFVATRQVCELFDSSSSTENPVTYRMTDSCSIAEDEQVYDGPQGTGFRYYKVPKCVSAAYDVHWKETCSALVLPVHEYPVVFIQSTPNVKSAIRAFREIGADVLVPPRHAYAFVGYAWEELSFGGESGGVHLVRFETRSLLVVGLPSMCVLGPHKAASKNSRERAAQICVNLLSLVRKLCGRDALSDEAVKKLKLVTSQGQDVMDRSFSATDSVLHANYVAVMRRGCVAGGQAGGKAVTTARALCAPSIKYSTSGKAFQNENQALGAKGGKVSLARGTGIHAIMNQSERDKNSSAGGKASAAKRAEKFGPGKKLALKTFPEPTDSEITKKRLQSNFIKRWRPAFCLENPNIAIAEQLKDVGPSHSYHAWRVQHQHALDKENSRKSHARLYKERVTKARTTPILKENNPNV
jgi:hypothetical protein